MFIKMYAKYLSLQEKGQGLVEYAIIVVAVVLIAIVVRAIFWPSVQNLFNGLSTNIQNAVK